MLTIGMISSWNGSKVISISLCGTLTVAFGNPKDGVVARQDMITPMKQQVIRKRRILLVIKTPIEKMKVELLSYI